MNILLRKARSAFIRGRRLLVSQRFGFSPESIYQNEFYSDGGFEKTDQSAAAIVDWTMTMLNPTSMLDLGSGAGHYLRAFQTKGIQAVGFEASSTGVRRAGEDVLAVSYDLKTPLVLSRPFDLVICIEVAEHLPTRASKTLVQSIAQNAKSAILFTAAPPGTPGTDHINCQPKEFWARLFAEEGFTINDELTAELRNVAEKHQCAEWWRNWSWCLTPSHPQ